MQSFNDDDKIKKKNTNKNSNRYKRKNYNVSSYWQPGQELTKNDNLLLNEVINFYKDNGFTPTKDDISNVVELKARFRTWKNVLVAAKLPSRNDPENQRKRMNAINRQKNENC